MNFTTFYLIFLLIAVLYRLKMRNRILSTHMERGKIYAQWTLKTLFISYILIVIVTVTEYFIYKRKINFIVTTLGFVIYLVGLVGRSIPVKILGKYWSPHIEIRKTQRLIKEGLYKYMRHPYYFFFLFEITGFPLIPNSYYSFLLALLLYFPLVLIRIHYEEKALIEKFGQEYLDYKKEIPALLPFTFKKRKSQNPFNEDEITKTN